MEFIILPLLAPNASPKDGLKAMRWMQRAAVIVDAKALPFNLGQSPSLIKAGEIFWGLAQQKQHLSNLTGTPVYKLSEQEIKQRHLDISDPHKTSFKYEALLDEVGKTYALVETVAGLVKIVSRHESDVYADGLQVGPKQCYCIGPCRHPYEPPPQGETGDDCLICPSTLHCEPD